jgi:hypothetical protein
MPDVVLAFHFLANKLQPMTVGEYRLLNADRLP